MNTTTDAVVAIALSVLLFDSLEFAARADNAALTTKPQPAISFDIGGFFDAYR